MGNKCFKNKSPSSRRHDDDVPNNKRGKKGDKYALDGQANAGFAQEASSRGGTPGADGDFTDLSTVQATDASGRIIHVPGGQDEVRIELANGPNHERPIDVPGDKGGNVTKVQVNNHGNAPHGDVTPDMAMRPNGGAMDLDFEIDMENVGDKDNSQQNKKEDASDIVLTLKDKDSDNSSLSSRGSDRNDFAHRFQGVQLAESGGFANPALEVSDNECKSLSDVSHDDHNINLQFVAGKTTPQVQLNDLHNEQTRSQSPDSLNKQALELAAEDSESDKESDKLSRASDEADKMQFHNIMHMSSPFAAAAANEQDSQQQFTLQTNEPNPMRHSPVETDETDHVVLGANIQSAEPEIQVNDPFKVNDPFRLRKRADSSASSASSSSSKKSDLAFNAVLNLDTKLNVKRKSHSSKSSRSSSNASAKIDSVINVKDKHETEPLEKEMERREEEEEEEEEEDSYTPKPSPFGSLFPAFHFKNDGEGVEADREIGEIMMEIERIEEHLAGELAGEQEAEELSRHIVEKLDEVTALREQAEIMFDNDVITQLELGEEDIGCFKDPGDVMQWYNMSMDEVNEAVGMALLELSMLEPCDHALIREQLSYHRDAQSDLLRKKTQLKRAVTLRQQQEERRPQGVVPQQKQDMAAAFNYAPVQLLQDSGDGNDQGANSDEEITLDFVGRSNKDTNKGDLSPFFATIDNNETTDSPTVIPTEQFEQHMQQLDQRDPSPELKLEDLVGRRDRDSPSPVLLGITMQDPDMKLLEKQDAPAVIVSRSNEHGSSGSSSDEEQEAKRPVIPFSNPAYDEGQVTSEQQPKLLSTSWDDEDMLDLTPSKEKPIDSNKLQVDMKFPELESLEYGETNINLQSEEVSGQHAQKPAHSSDEDEEVNEDTIKPESHNRRELNPSEIDIDFGFDPSDFDQKHEVHDVMTNQHQSQNSELLMGLGPRNDRIESPVNQKRKDSHSSSEDESPIGVNQFATPYKLEDDLWNKVENFPTSDIQINLNSDLPQAKPTELQTEIVPQLKKASRSRSSSSSSSSGDEVVEQDIIAHVAKKQPSVDMQLEHSQVVAKEEVTTKTEIPSGNLKASLMYGSDSDSDSEPEIVPVPKKIVPIAAPISQKMIYDDDSDIEEKEVNYEIVSEQRTKPESPKPEVSLPDRHSDSNSDDSVEDIVNHALQLDKDKSEAPHKPVVAAAKYIDFQYAQPYLDFSDKLAKEIIETSSNEASSPRDHVGGLEAEIQTSAHAQINMDIQTDTKLTVEQSSQSTAYTSAEAHSTQTDTRQYSDCAIETDPADAAVMVSKDIGAMETQATSEETQTTKRVIAPVMTFRSDTDEDEDAKSAESDDSDVDGVRREYDVMMAKPLSKAKPITGSRSGSSSNSSQSESDSDQDKHNSSSDDGGALHADSTSPDAHAPSSAAKEQLKETLRDDIIGTIHGLTQGDFTELLGVYRDQRKQLQNQRDAERSRHQRSLWEILEERKKKSDQHVHAGEDQSDEEKTKAQTNGKSSDDMHSDSDVSSDAADVEEGLLRAEELNQTIQEMDLEIVHQACENNNRDVADDMIQRHFALVEKMRRDKQETLAQHRAKMMAKLEHRGQAAALSSSSSSDTCNEENTDMKDEAISAEMNELTGAFLGVIKTKRDMDEQELYDLLLQYREEQQELIRKREYEKLRIQEKLKERLRKKQEQRKRSSASSSDEDEKEKPEHSVAQMDAAFYERMVKRYQSGEMDEDQLSAMLDAHLQEVDAFKRNLRGMLAERRKKKRQNPSASMKMREAGALVERSHEEAERIRGLRQAEKEKADQRLKEKMQKKKATAYDETPDLPAPKRPTRKQEHTRDQTHISMNYENVEYDV